MKIPSFGKELSRKCCLTLALACGFFVGSAGAQVIVTDPGNIATNETGFASQLAKTIEQYTQQIQQYQTQLQQYEQMLSKIEGLSSGMSLLPNQLQPITNIDALIQANCPGASGGGVLGGLLNSMSSLLSQSITSSQQQVCAAITYTQIDKYNKTVVVLNQLNNYGAKFQQVEQVLAMVSTQADAGRAANQAADYNNALTTQMSDWQGQMRADDAMISALEGQQNTLAKVALHGQNTVLGNVVQAGALKVAFTVHQ